MGCTQSYTRSDFNAIRMSYISREDNFSFIRIITTFIYD